MTAPAVPPLTDQPVGKPLLLRGPLAETDLLPHSRDFQARVGRPVGPADTDATPCVVVLTRTADREIDELSLRLAALGIPLLRPDSDRCAGQSISYDLDAEVLITPGGAFRPRVGWRRYFQTSALPAATEPRLAAYARDQWLPWADTVLAGPSARRRQPCRRPRPRHPARPRARSGTEDAGHARDHDAGRCRAPHPRRRRPHRQDAGGALRGARAGTCHRHRPTPRQPQRAGRGRRRGTRARARPRADPVRARATDLRGGRRADRVRCAGIDRPRPGGRISTASGRLPSRFRAGSRGRCTRCCAASPWTSRHSTSSTHREGRCSWRSTPRVTGCGARRRPDAHR